MKERTPERRQQQRRDTIHAAENNKCIGSSSFGLAHRQISLPRFVVAYNNSALQDVEAFKQRSGHTVEQTTAIHLLPNLVSVEEDRVISSSWK